METKEPAGIIYSGIFLNERSTETLKRYPGMRLSRLIDNLHIMLQFRPSEVKRDLLGKAVYFKVVAYGNNGRNEGVRVAEFAGDPGIMEQVESVRVPHVTISCGNGGRPAETADLDFQPVRRVVTLAGRYGIFCDDAKVHFSPEGVSGCV